MPSLNTKRCLAKLESQPVAVLATVGTEGPHLVPIVFAILEGRIVFAVDHKPKRTMDLRRLANIRDNGRVSVLAHEYCDDWSQLWWVRADGDAVIDVEGSDWQAATAALQSRYTQYANQAPVGPVVSITVTGWTGWEARVDQGA